MSDPRFYPRLEALRGVAALMVAYFHALAIVRVEGYVPLKIKSVLNMAGNSSAGVAIFFVLSGYVLGRSLDASSGRLPSEAVKFLVRRTLRIWPAMAVCLAICFLWVGFVFHPATYAAASKDYYEHWRLGATLKDLWLDLLLQQTYLNAVTWTLQVEMIAAVLFVPIWWVCRRSLVASIALTAAWAAWFQSAPEPSRLAFVYMMVLGLQAGLAVRFAVRSLSGRAVKACLLLAFLGCGVAARYPRTTDVGTWLVHSAFAYAIVVMAVASHERVGLRWLDHRATRFMGRISYSFYLWHFPVLWVVATLGFATTDAAIWLAWPNSMAGVLLIVSTLVAIPIAWASHRLIERPMIGLAKALTPGGRA
jgi:peptidoglycan/LPS O-acetylase OafA/YrhL